MSTNKEIKFTMHKSKKLFVKNRLVLHFNNVGNPYLSMYLYKNDRLDLSETYKFEEHEIVNGLPVNINKIADIINNFVTKIDSIQLAISTDDLIKTTTSLPKISKAKAKKLYKAEVKNDIGERKDNYIPFFEYYYHSLGYIFYTYYLPVNIVNTFVKVASLLKTKLTKVDLFSHFLFNNVKSIINEDYILHHDENEVSTFVLSFGKAFSGCASFASKEENVKINYVSNIVKHNFELEKKEIDYIYSNNAKLVDDLNEVKDFEVSLETYNFKGIDL